MYKIEKGIPVAKVSGLKGAREIYPWRIMDVGDSFFVPNKKTPNMSAAAHAAGVRHGIKLKCRAEGNGVRVWRVE